MKKIKNGNYPFLEAVNIKNYELGLNILYKNNKEMYFHNLFLKLINKVNFEAVKLLIEYANKNNIILELNAKDKDGKYPLLEVIKVKNFELVTLLIEYADKNGIILNLNKKNEDKYPLLEVIKNNNIEMIKLLMEYANNNSIILELNEKDQYGISPILAALKKKS